MWANTFMIRANGGGGETGWLALRKGLLVRRVDGSLLRLLECVEARKAGHSMLAVGLTLEDIGNNGND